MHKARSHHKVSTVQEQEDNHNTIHEGNTISEAASAAGFDWTSSLLAHDLLPRPAQSMPTPNTKPHITKSSQCVRCASAGSQASDLRFAPAGVHRGPPPRSSAYATLSVHTHNPTIVAAANPELGGCNSTELYNANLIRPSLDAALDSDFLPHPPRCLLSSLAECAGLMHWCCSLPEASYRVSPR